MDELIGAALDAAVSGVMGWSYVEGRSLGATQDYAACLRLVEVLRITLMAPSAEDPNWIAMRSRGALGQHTDPRVAICRAVVAGGIRA